MNKHSIQYQLNSTVMTTVTFALLLSSLCMLIYSVNVYYDNKAESLMSRSHLVARALVPSMQFDDYQLAENYLATLKAEDDVLNAFIFDENLKVYAALNENIDTDFNPNLFINTGVVVDKSTMIYMTPVMDNGETTGYLLIKVGFHLTRALRTHLFIYFIVFITSLIAAYWFSLKVQKKIVQPLNGVTQLMRRIAITNDLSQRYNSEVKGEIGSLVKAINQLLQELEEKRHELVVVNKSLELEVNERREAEVALKASQKQYLDLNTQLEERVKNRTKQLESANQELEAFSYSVSHDLRAPLRAMDGFSQALLEDYADRLDDEGQDYLNRVRAAAQRMGGLIDDMLMLSRVSRTDMKLEMTNLSLMAADILKELEEQDHERQVTYHLQPNLMAYCDQHLMKIALTNLLSNAWKYSSSNEHAFIEFGQNLEQTFFIKDNGVGFDMKYGHKLFTAFQRLHTAQEFPGSGIGLATVKRVMSRHDGQVWAESEIEKGSIFYFSLPQA